MKRKCKYEENTIPEPGIHNYILKKQKLLLDNNDIFSLGEPAIKDEPNNIKDLDNLHSNITLQLNINNLSTTVKNNK